MIVLIILRIIIIIITPQALKVAKVAKVVKTIPQHTTTRCTDVLTLAASRVERIDVTPISSVRQPGPSGTDRAQSGSYTTSTRLYRRFAASATSWRSLVEQLAR